MVPMKYLRKEEDLQRKHILQEQNLASRHIAEERQVISTTTGPQVQMAERVRVTERKEVDHQIGTYHVPGPAVSVPVQKTTLPPREVKRYVKEERRIIEQPLPPVVVQQRAPQFKEVDTVTTTTTTTTAPLAQPAPLSVPLPPPPPPIASTHLEKFTYADGTTTAVPAVEQVPTQYVKVAPPHAMPRPIAAY